MIPAFGHAESKWVWTNRRRYVLIYLGNLVSDTPVALISPNTPRSTPLSNLHNDMHCSS